MSAEVLAKRLGSKELREKELEAAQSAWATLQILQCMWEKSWTLLAELFWMLPLRRKGLHLEEHLYTVKVDDTQNECQALHQSHRQGPVILLGSIFGSLHT